MDVQFDEDKNYRSLRASTPSRHGMLTRLVVALGLARDEQGAARVLIGIAVLILLAAVTIYWRANPHARKDFTPEEKARIPFVGGPFTR